MPPLRCRMRISLRVIAFIMLCMVLLIFSSWHYLEDEPPLLYDDSSRRKGQRTSALVGHSPSFYFKPFLDLNNTELGDSDSKCSEKYGVGLIQGWKAQKKLVCVPDETTALQTSMDCFYHKDQATENLCEVRKFALDVAKIKSIESLDQDDAQVWGGSMVGQCTLDSNEFQESRFGNAAQKRLLHAFVTTKSEIQCDKWYEKPVFVLSRWDATNLYHAHEDFIQTFSAYLVAGLDVKDTLIVLADAMKLGPFFDFWDHVMSNMNGPLTDEDKSMREHRPHVMRLNEFLDSVTRNLTTQAQHVCLRRAVFGVHAGVSPMSREIGHKANCKPPTSALFVSFRIFVLERLGFESDKVAIAKQVKDKSPIKVTYITRKGHLRHIQNEDVLLKQITTAVCSSYVKSCPVEVKLHDYMSLSFYDQVKLARESDVMLGMHGAALTSGIYLLKTGVLMEIGHPSRAGNEHFANLASFVGLYYNRFEGDDVLQPHWREAIVQGVVSAVKDVQRRRAEFKE